MAFEKPQEQILEEPKWSFLETGDGYLALIQGALQKTDEGGRRLIEFLIKPSLLLRKRYNIREEQLNDNGAMLFTVLEADLVPLNIFDDANRKWLYMKTFNHEETELSKLHWKLKQQLESETKKRIMVEGEILWMQEQLQLAKTNPQQYMAQGLEIYDRIGSKMAEFFKNKKKEDLEE